MAKKSKSKKDKKSKNKLLAEFITFIRRGNVVDLAVGIIIGGAFGKIVSSLVSDIITPIISLALGIVDFKVLRIVFREAVVAGDGTVTSPAVTLNYGIFIQAIIDFLVIALTIFLVLKVYASIKNRLHRKQVEEENAAMAEVLAAAADKPKTPTIDEQQLEVLKQLKALMEINSQK